MLLAIDDPDLGVYPMKAGKQGTARSPACSAATLLLT